MRTNDEMIHLFESEQQKNDTGGEPLLKRNKTTTKRQASRPMFELLKARFLPWVIVI
jgi:hypothetical protein